MYWRRTEIGAPPADPAKFRAEVRAHVPHDLLHPLQVSGTEYLVPVPGNEDQVDVKDEDTVLASAYAAVPGYETKYTERVQLRYDYRLYPTPGQRAALARAFGCARVVFNDGLRARQEAHAAVLPCISDAEVPARLTASKATPERAWPGEVSAVVLQQSLADLNTAYRNFSASVTGKRTGPKIKPPRFKSRKDHRQAIRFTANARFPGTGERETAAAEDRGRAGAAVPGSAVRAVQRDRDPGFCGPVRRQFRHRGRAGHPARDGTCGRHRPGADSGGHSEACPARRRAAGTGPGPG
jgi:hypothetical protein